jgi:DNA-binding response OmpR family regulator
MRVLVVEDERDTAEALSWGLRAEGYVVDVAGNGVDGLWKATENAYDVIVLDVMLPGLDGYQVARRLREAGRWTPVLMLTAMDDDLDHAEGLDSGADDYLPKPFSYPVLLAHLRSLTRRTLGARPAVCGGGYKGNFAKQVGAGVVCAFTDTKCAHNWYRTNGPAAATLKDGAQFVVSKLGAVRYAQGRLVKRVAWLSRRVGW